VLTPPDFQTWLQLGAPLVANHKQAKWLLGDWLLQSDLAGSGVWLDKVPGIHPGLWVQAAAQHYGYAYDTFLQFKRVAAAFPPATRVAGLSWHHHLAVAAIESAAVRAEWLSLAKFAGWSSKDLQQKVAIAKAGLTMSEAVQLSQIAAVVGMAPGEVQVLIVRAFLAKNDETHSEFIFKHRASFE
jgi:hypothetical protein